MNETKIEWCTHTWNPVTGCLHDCEYCYARRWISRFEPHACERPMVDPDSGATGLLNEGKDHPNCWRMSYPTKLEEGDGTYTRTTPYPKGFAPTLHAYTMGYPAKRKVPSAIFVSSMGDLFGKWVPDVWIESVFDACRAAPWHTYLFLTKNPERYMELAGAGKLPEDKNFWYGSTATGPDMRFWWSKYHNTFVSIEPLVEPFEPAGEDGGVKKVGWVIIGAMTGPGSKLHQPKREWVEAIVEDARDAGVPVLMKDSMAGIWGADLIREFPEGIPRSDDKPAPIPRCRACEYATSTEQGKRGTSYSCEIGWESKQYDDRTEARHILGRYTRTSPPWCPLREENKKGELKC